MDRNLDLEGELSHTAQGVSKVLRFGAVPKAVRRGLRIPAVPIEARGPLDAPRVRADVSGVPLATARGLLGLPSRALDVNRGVIDAARDMGRHVFGAKPRSNEHDTEAPE